MSDPSLFKWHLFEADIILCAVRWYLRYALRYRDVEELLQEWGVQVDHTTVFRWVQRYGPELNKWCRPQLKSTNDSYRVDETDSWINKQWYDLYRDVDSGGATLDFMLSPARDAEAAEHFCRQVLQASNTLTPRVISIDKNAAHPPKPRHDFRDIYGELSGSYRGYLLVVPSREVEWGGCRAGCSITSCFQGYSLFITTYHQLGSSISACYREV